MVCCAASCRAALSELRVVFSSVMRTSNDAHHLGKEFRGCTAAFESVSKREDFGTVGQTKRWLRVKQLTNRTWLSGVAEKVQYRVPSRRFAKFIRLTNPMEANPARPQS